MKCITPATLKARVDKITMGSFIPLELVVVLWLCKCMNYMSYLHCHRES